MVHNLEYTGTLVPGYPKKSGPDKIFMLSWSLVDDSFCTVGPKHIAFWTINGAGPKKGTFGSVDKQTNLACVTYDD